MRFGLIVAFVLVFTSCKEHAKKHDISMNKHISDSESVVSEDLDLEVYDFAGFKKFLNQTDDQVHVINFWATWCAPCVKELPYFEQLNAEYAHKNVDVLLVSLDFPHLYESKLKPFIKNENITSKVIALDDVDMNSWIPEVDKTWSGSLPATIIYKNKERKFFEQSFTFEELETEINQFLN
ncbi:TlpA disulfide reductase family protein [Mariniflexile sp.]|uniref:TlpA disulfide reductase family protein n=1 Tax=Mariniflexile sp. TaxID=1979402 RepID=UPI00356ABBC0